jgi:oligopeptide/dipeptide ABC transporter ATP-binding protein
MRLQPIEGQPPDLIFPPAGCAFQSRCAYALPECQKEHPVLKEITPGHFAACLVIQKGMKPWQK